MESRDRAADPPLHSHVVAHRITAALAGRPAADVFDGVGYCWVETGAGRAAFATSEFFAEPDPTLALRAPKQSWHAGKVLIERSWIGDRLERRLDQPTQASPSTAASSA